MSNVREKNRRFYDRFVAGLIHTGFPEYEDRIAVGIAGEGSDCFGYDDEISRDHDFGRAFASGSPMRTWRGSAPSFPPPITSLSAARKGAITRTGSGNGEAS